MSITTFTIEIDSRVTGDLLRETEVLAARLKKCVREEMVGSLYPGLAMDQAVRLETFADNLRRLHFDATGDRIPPTVERQADADA